MPDIYEWAVKRNGHFVDLKGFKPSTSALTVNQGGPLMIEVSKSNYQRK